MQVFVLVVLLVSDIRNNDVMAEVTNPLEIYSSLEACNRAKAQLQLEPLAKEDGRGVACVRVSQ
jgi:hypothetical protein